MESVLVREETFRGRTLDGSAGATATEAPSVPLTFDDMFSRFHTPIYGYILGIVGNVEQAQDLTQDTFVKAFKALPAAHDPILPAWLYRIATNTALDALRHRRLLSWLPFAPGAEEYLPSGAPDLPSSIAESEAVRQALACLTPPQRACLLLRAHEGFTLDEIAVTLRMSKGNVKMTLHRAKERFRCAYVATDEGPRS